MADIRLSWQMKWEIHLPCYRYKEEAAEGIEYKKTAEVYEFYLHDKSANGQSNAVMSSSLGTVTNTGKDTDLTLTNLFEDTPTSVFPSTEV